MFKYMHALGTHVVLGKHGVTHPLEGSTKWLHDMITVLFPIHRHIYFWRRDITKANFFFSFVICGWRQGTGKIVLPLRSIKSSDGTGGQAGTFRWTSPEGHLVCPE